MWHLPAQSPQGWHWGQQSSVQVFIISCHALSHLYFRLERKQFYAGNLKINSQAVKTIFTGNLKLLPGLLAFSSSIVDIKNSFPDQIIGISVYQKYYLALPQNLRWSSLRPQLTQLLTFVTKSSISDFAVDLDTALNI